MPNTEEAVRRIEEARRRIEEARMLGARSLVLANLKLSELPETIGQLCQLQELNLSGNQLNTLPEATGQLSRLQKLDLADNQLSALPETIGQLCQLQKLDLARNRLSTLPEAIGQLSQLQKLELSGNRLSTLPETIGQLSQLQELHLSNNRLRALPEAIGRLSQIQELYLSGNQLNTLPEAIGQLSHLRTLDFSECKELRRFTPLESLLPTLKELRLFGCKLEDLPSEICGESNIENVLDKVRAHYEDLKSGQRFDLEVKVLFLGNAGVGKTQLCRRLRDLEFDPSISTTHAIQLGEMHLQLEEFERPCSAESVGLRRSGNLSRFACALSSGAGCLAYSLDP